MIDKTFTFNEVNYINQLGNKSCNGTVQVFKDTLILQSNFDLNKLPIKVDGDIDKGDCQESMLIINREEQILLKNSKNLFVVFNKKDTISVKSDTIRYNSRINEFFIILKNKPDDYLLKYYNELPIELLTEEDFIIISNLNTSKGNRLKTVIYLNENEYCVLKVSLNVNRDLWNYQTINDTLINRNDGFYIWHSILFDRTALLKLSKN